MMPVLPAVTATLVMLTLCRARAASFDPVDLVQASEFHPVLADIEDADSKFRMAMDVAPLLRLNGGPLALRNSWLAQASQLSSQLDKRYQPTGFLGSRGKRVITDFEPLLLASQDGGKKRQPHTGFHGSRG